MEKFLCDKKCCTVYIKIPKEKKTYTHTFRRKAGIFIYDPNTNKVLLVQSNGNLWGPPKGTRKYNENTKNCAKREVMEETGLQIPVCKFSRILYINNHATYFYVEQPECSISLQENPDELDNDATGIGWINVNCLEEYIKNGNITLTKHCRILFERFLGKIFPYSDFQLVTR